MQRATHNVACALLWSLAGELGQSSLAGSQKAPVPYLRSTMTSSSLQGTQGERQPALLGRKCCHSPPRSLRKRPSVTFLESS